MPEHEVMEKWMVLAQPAKQHEMLKRTEGEWNVEMKMWMSPTEPPSEAKGTARYKMILDGRVMVEEFHATMMGQPYQGYGLMGYDNFTKKWWQTWCDSMGTGLFHAVGTESADGKTVTMSGKADRPSTGQKGVEMKTVTRIISDNHHVFETYDVGPGGKEVKTMELHYRRK
jgi:hypothetical protein